MADHLGTVRGLVDAAGVVVSHASYNAFGAATGATGSVATTDFGYTGKLFDATTGLQNNWNRWYDATTGRWISEDPIGFAAGDANLSRYIENAVTANIDPTGQGIVSVVRLTKPGYYGLKKLIQREGLSGLFAVHHKIGRSIFKNREFGPWLHKLGFKSNDVCNVIALPTKELKQNAGKWIRRSGHGGRHIKGYVEDIVESRLRKIKRQYNAP